MVIQPPVVPALRIVSTVLFLVLFLFMLSSSSLLSRTATQPFVKAQFFFLEVIKEINTIELLSMILHFAFVSIYLLNLT